MNGAAVRDTLVDDDEVIPDSEIIYLDDSEIELVENNEPLFCWCCGYPSDDISHMTLENGQRRKIDCEICDVCLDAPWILDSWLNSWLYSTDTKAILETIAYMCNRVIDEDKSYQTG